MCSEPFICITLIYNQMWIKRNVDNVLDADLFFKSLLIAFRN